MDIIHKTNTLPANIPDLQKFILFSREKLKAIRLQINAIDRLDIAREVEKQKREEAQLLAYVLLDAEVKVGELLKAIAKKPISSESSSGGTFGGREKSLPDDISKGQSHIYQKLAGNKDVVEKVKAYAKEKDLLPTRTECLKQIKEKNKDEDRMKRIKLGNTISLSIENIDLRFGDFEKVLDDIPDNSLDLILTDPPYAEKYLDEWSKLSLFASKKLKKHGFCIAYAGQMFMSDILNRMSEHLDLYWISALIHSSRKTLVKGRNIQCGWKPILIFQKDFKKVFNFIDVINGTGTEKEYHDWQQSELELKEIIEKFTVPGDTICEPFAGGGTTIVAGYKLGRKIIASEIDLDQYNLCKERIDSISNISTEDKNDFDGLGNIFRQEITSVMQPI